MMNWLDSHCHINDEAFREDLEDVLGRMAENDVRKAMIISSYIEDYGFALKISHPDIVFKHSLGIYPGDVDDVDEEMFHSMRSSMKKMTAMRSERSDWIITGTRKTKKDRKRSSNVS